MNLFLLKPHATHLDSELHRCLTAFDLVFLGIGAIIGAGIFVLTGIAAATKAGPAVVISYIISGIACSFAALSYAELASSVGGSGSAYNYAYSSVGELIAWIIGWDLILEYAACASTVSIGWSGYMNNVLSTLGVKLPEVLQKSPFEGGYFNISACLIVLLLTTLLIFGVKRSVRFNAAIVFVKLSVIGIFIAVALQHVDVNHWDVFAPFGWVGIMKGAALVFFAYIGFDAVSTAAEEAIKPQRDISIGIIGSLAICTIIYIIVSGLLTLITPYTALNVTSPIAESLLQLGHKFAAGTIALGAIAGLTSVILIFIYGLTRVTYAISRDGLLPAFFSKINPNTKTPTRIIILGGLMIAVFAGIAPLEIIAEMVNIGTLAAFVIVCTSVIVLRRIRPEMPRPFKVPFGVVIPLLGILSCGYLMLSLSWHTWVRFVLWMAIGIVIYCFYGYSNSKLRLKS